MCIAILDRLGEPIDAPHTAAIATHAIRAITRLLATVAHRTYHASSDATDRTNRAPLAA